MIARTLFASSTPFLLVALVVRADSAAASPASVVVASAAGADEGVTWAARTASPRAVVPEGDPAARDWIAALLARCGHGEAGLEEVARHVVTARIAGRAHLDVAALTFSLRAAGEPHVWPHAWILAGSAHDRATTAAKLEAWGASFRDAGDRRCGVAIGTAKDGTEVTAAVAVDALADLAPLPTSAHVGMWLTLDARILVPLAAREAHVIVQGPGTDPRPVPTWLEEEEDARVHIRARFTPDRPGPFTVQVVADAANGPRPILEARIFADVPPPDRFEATIAPGEDADVAPPTASDADRLVAMVAKLRDEEALPRLSRERNLDAIALAHTHRMQAARKVGHDVGDGDPERRVEAAAVRARLVGENVAHAMSIALAHRALYESPSHRANLVRGEFNRIGVGVVDDLDGSVWVTEIFAADRD